MPTMTLIDYGCHSLSYRLAARLCDSGLATRYFVNSSLESSNLSSVCQWVEDKLQKVRNITYRKPYGRMSLAERLRKEAEWADVPARLSAAVVVIVPPDSSAGSFCVPSKILSYLCAGRATVIAIDAENLAARTHKQCGSGIIVETGDSAAYISAVTKLIDDRALRHEKGSNARAYAENAFNLDSIVETFLDILAQAGIQFRPVQPSKSAPDFAHSIM